MSPHLGSISFPRFRAEHTARAAERVWRRRTSQELSLYTSPRMAAPATLWEWLQYDKPLSMPLNNRTFGAHQILLTATPIMKVWFTLGRAGAPPILPQ